MMSSINLASKYSGQIAQKFTHASYFAGNVSQDYDFAGVKSLTIYTPVTVDLNDYDRTAAANRFGTPVEMEDTIQELTMTQDKGFSITIDRGNDSDQMLIKESGKMLGVQLAEKVVPLMDKYALKKYFAEAGNIVEAAAAPTKDTIVGLIFAAATTLDNKLVPADNRYLYIKATYYNMLRQASEFLAVDSLAAKALAKGMVGEIADMKVIKVPDCYFPENTYFLIAHKDAVILPNKIKTARVLKNVPGLDGSLLEGRNYFDAFVLGAKSDGVYALVAKDKVCAVPTVTKGNTTTEIASTTSGAEIKYTLDGSDPRYSATAKIYTAAITNPEAGVEIKAYAAKSGMFASGVVKHVCE